MLMLERGWWYAVTRNRRWNAEIDQRSSLLLSGEKMMP
jgi:hypothetical protein